MEQCAVCTSNQCKPASRHPHHLPRIPIGYLPPGRRRCAVPVERHRSRSNDPCPLSFPDGRSVFTFLPSQMATCVLVARGWRCLCIATCSDIRLRHPHSRTLTSPRQHTMLINTRGDPLK